MSAHERGKPVPLDAHRAIEMGIAPVPEDVPLYACTECGCLIVTAFLHRHREKCPL